MLTFLLFIFSMFVETASFTSAKAEVSTTVNSEIMRERIAERKKIADSINTLKSAFAALECLKVEEVVETQVLYNYVKGTVYHADPNQTDDTPFLTADNSVIDNTVINDLRWVALSRDLLNRQFTDPWGRRHNWTGKIKLGDTIWVDYNNKTLWKVCHPVFKHVNRKYDSTMVARHDAYYNKQKAKYDQIKGYWIVHDIMGTEYWLKNRKGEYILDKNGKKQLIKIYSAIDFLQNPEVGMMDVWDRHITISKRTVRYITPKPEILLASN